MTGQGNFDYDYDYDNDSDNDNDGDGDSENVKANDAPAKSKRSHPPLFPLFDSLFPETEDKSQPETHHPVPIAYQL